jgi:hypothetical protein
MTDQLRRLIEFARQQPPMTPDELREQEISFAWGNIAYENPRITRQMVERAISRDKPE